jgi:hypothetical protein
LEKRNKYLIIVVIILIIAIGIAGFFAYQSYRMSQVDKLMVEAKNITNQIGVVSNETDDITNKTPINYDKIYANIDEMTDLVKQRKAVDEKAYQYADGPYKELITIYLKQSELQINYLGLWKSRVQYLQQNNLYQVNEINKQEDNNLNELTKAINDAKTFKSTHPDVKEHMQKYWNYTDE